MGAAWGMVSHFPQVSCPGGAELRLPGKHIPTDCAGGGPEARSPQLMVVSANTEAVRSRGWAVLALPGCRQL